jgi:hypothetical protein
MKARLRSFAALWLVLQAAACGESPTQPKIDPPPTEPPPVAEKRLELKGIEGLIPGQVATVRGDQLSLLSSLTLDGQTVTFEKVSETEGRFVVPELRACETDGRVVEVVANRGEKKLSAPVLLPGALTLEVGESRVLTAQDLACLQLSRADAAYVLSVANFKVVEPLATEPVFTLKSFGAQARGSSTAPSWSRSTAGASGFSFAPDAAAARHGEVSASQARLMASVAASSAGTVRPDPKAHTPVAPIDPRMSTAGVGEVFHLVDKQKLMDNLRVDTRGTLPREKAPLMEVKVVAVAGRHVFVIATDDPEAANFDLPEVRQKLQEAALLSERYAIAAIQKAFAPGYDGWPGAGGRIFTLFRPLYAGTQGGVVETSPPYDDSHYFDRFSNEAPILAVDHKIWTSTPAAISTIVVHELAHVADDGARFWDYGLATGSSTGWYGEALATNAEETAARLYSSQETGAKYKSGTGLGTDLAYWPSTTAHEQSPFGRLGDRMTTAGPGAYDTGARFMLYAREKLGSAGFHNAPGATLHERLAARAQARGEIDPNRHATLDANFAPQAIAEVLDMPLEQLLDEFVQAELTHGLIDEAVLREKHLPQIRSWGLSVPAERGIPAHTLPTHRLERNQDTQARAVTVPMGGHDHWYVPAEKDKGLSIQATDVQLQVHHKVRLTRLR